MLWEESRNKGNIQICLLRLQLFVTQGLLDLEVTVFVFKKAYSNTLCTWEFHSTVENAHLKKQLMSDVESRKTCSVTQCP